MLYSLGLRGYVRCLGKEIDNLGRPFESVMRMGTGCSADDSSSISSYLSLKNEPPMTRGNVLLLKRDVSTHPIIRSPHIHFNIGRNHRRALRRWFGRGFFPCRGIMDGSAGDGIGDSNIWFTPYLEEKLDDHEGDSKAPSGGGARRMDIVGGAWREVRIMMGQLRLCCSVPSRTCLLPAAGQKQHPI